MFNIHYYNKYYYLIIFFDVQSSYISKNDSNSLDCGYTVESISKALKKYTKLTDEQKQEMINNGLETCNKYDWDDISKNYYEVYKSMVK